MVSLRQVVKAAVYGTRYDHLPGSQVLYLRPGERHVRRAQRSWLHRRAPVVSLDDYRSATPLGEIEEFIDCRLCGETQQQPVYQPRDENGGWSYRVVRCPSCGFLYRNPNIRPERVGDLYAAGYSDFLTGDYIRNRHRRYGVCMDGVSPIFDSGEGRRLLDFGCGVGIFLSLAEERGFEASRLLSAAGFAHVGFAPFYGDEIGSGESELAPAEVERIKNRVRDTDFGNMLVAVGFATDEAAQRWGAGVL